MDLLVSFSVVGVMIFTYAVIGLYKGYPFQQVLYSSLFLALPLLCIFLVYWMGIVKEKSLNSQTSHNNHILDTEEAMDGINNKDKKEQRSDK